MTISNKIKNSFIFDDVHLKEVESHKHSVIFSNNLSWNLQINERVCVSQSVYGVNCGNEPFDVYFVSKYVYISYQHSKNNTTFFFCVNFW